MNKQWNEASIDEENSLCHVSLQDVDDRGSS